MNNKETNNNLIKIQEMLMNQMKRLDDDNLMNTKNKDEVARGNALSQSAVTFLKSVNVGLRVMEIAEKTNVSKTKMSKALGIVDEK